MAERDKWGPTICAAVGGKTKHKKLYGYGGNMSKLPTGSGIVGDHLLESWEGKILQCPSNLIK